MPPSPYDENWNLDMQAIDNLAVEMQLNHPHTFSLVAAQKAAQCGGCGAKLVSERVDESGRNVQDFACGHRYTIGRRTVSIERA